MRKLAVLLLVALVVTACSPAVAPTSAPAPAKAEPTQVPATPAPAKIEPTQAPAQSSGTGVTLPAVDPLQVTGDIISAGSSTVFPLSEAMAERFADEGYQGKITIDSIGSGAGFERFCKTGETDMANASRGIKEEEIELCKAINREPVEFRVGTDALAMVVSKDNTFLKDVTMEELAKIFSNTADKWSDVNPSWPAESILRFSPGTDSGTFDFFVEVVLGKQKQLLLDAKNLQLSEDDNVLVQGVLGSPVCDRVLWVRLLPGERGHAERTVGRGGSADSRDGG